MKKVLMLCFSLMTVSLQVSAFKESDLSKLKETNNCPKCDLVGADLAGMTLGGADLTGANLEGASL